MLIKNTNPNELLAEFKRNKDFCPYNEKELERLKEEAKRLYENISSSIHVFHNGVAFRYRLFDIFDGDVSYEYSEYGNVCKISSAYSPEQTEYVRFESCDEITFFYKSTNSDGTVWSVKVDRMNDWSREAWLWFGKEVKFKKLDIK